MLPNNDNMMYCIMSDGELVHGANGWAMGWTEQDAWEGALDPAEDWTITRAKNDGHYVRRCAIMIINPEKSKAPPREG